MEMWIEGTKCIPRSACEVLYGGIIVSRHGIDMMLEMMDKFAMPLNKGDFVRAIGGPFDGQCGKVILTDTVTMGKNECGVEFANYSEKGGDLGGATRQGHGDWYDVKKLIKVP